jgi:exonuclease III
MVYSGVEQKKRASSGVAILKDQKWKNKIESYIYVNGRILITRLQIERGHLTVIGIYAPEEGRVDYTEVFYETLQKQLQNISKGDGVIITGDFNARVAHQPIPRVVGSFGEDHLNRNGCEHRDFATYNNLKITNMFYRKKDIHKYAWAARGLRSVIDYIIVNINLSSQVRDTRSGEEVIYILTITW